MNALNNKLHAKMNWIKGMEFECHNRHHSLVIDAGHSHGGEDHGPTPKELLLDAMMGCTAMDVVSILQKMRQPLVTLSMDIEVEKTPENIFPVHFKSAVLIFKIGGAVELEKAIKAIDSSLTKYCGVNYIISKSCIITYKLMLNDVLAHEGKAQFE